MAFDDLEKRRDHLTAAVGALRDFEAAYRANLTGHLRKEIETLESGRRARRSAGRST
jgi:hypothetical protein